MIAFEDVKIKNGFIAILNTIHKGGWSVYCALLAYCENEDELEAEVTLKELGSITGYTIESVRQILRALEQENIIKRLHREQGRTQKYEIII